MAVLLQLLGANPIGGRVLAIIVPVVVVAFGTYFAVLMELQSFFDASSWQEAMRTGDTEE